MSCLSTSNTTAAAASINQSRATLNKSQELLLNKKINLLLNNTRCQNNTNNTSQASFNEEDIIISDETNVDEPDVDDLDEQQSIMNEKQTTVQIESNGSGSKPTLESLLISKFSRPLTPTNKRKKMKPNNQFQTDEESDDNTELNDDEDQHINGVGGVTIQDDDDDEEEQEEEDEVNESNHLIAKSDIENRYSKEQRNNLLANDLGNDLIVCGKCQADFKLADIVSFIEHKMQKCTSLAFNSTTAASGSNKNRSNQQLNVNNNSISRFNSGSINNNNKLKQQHFANRNRKGQFEDSEADEHNGWNNSNYLFIF